MHEATKTVEVDGINYQIRRMTPAVGSYIWQRLMAAVYKAREGRAEQLTAESIAEPETKKPSSEDRLRGMCGVTFMFLSFDDFQFVQRNAMRVLSREETTAGFLPVQADDGRWAAKELEENPFLVTKLTVEVLVWNLASFLT
jgi:hypothetical protein